MRPSNWRRACNVYNRLDNVTMTTTAANTSEPLAQQRLLRGLLTPWSLVLTILVVGVVAFWPTWTSLHWFWVESSRYSHGYLVAAICCYMVYKLRPQLDALEISPSIIGFLGFSALLLIWGIAHLGSIQAIHQIVLPALLWSACLAVVGWQAAWKLAFPLCYLYLAVPIWESGNFVLQFLTVHAVSFALAIADIPAFISGNFVSIPAGQFEIASGCSGLHYVIISFAIALLYGWLYLRSKVRSVVLVSAVIFVALLTNWVRVFIVVVAGHITDMQHFLVTEDHYYFGWALYGVAMLPVLWLARRMEWAEAATEAGESARSPGRRAAAVTSSRALAAFASLIALLVLASAVIYAKIPETGGLDATISLPGDRGGWVAQEVVGEPDWQPYFAGVAAEARVEYRRDANPISLYANVYLAQSQGNELIGYENRIEGANGKWRLSDDIIKDVSRNEGGSTSFREIRMIARDGTERLAYLRYVVGGRFFVNDLKAKLYYGYAVLTGRPDASIEIVSMPCKKSCDATREVLLSWLGSYAAHEGRLATVAVER